MDGAFEDWFEVTLRSSARGGRRLAQSPPSRHRCLLIKMTRARIAARSAEQIEPALLASVRPFNGIFCNVLHAQPCSRVSVGHVRSARQRSGALGDLNVGEIDREVTAW